MRTEIGGIVEAIEARELPLDFRGLCGEMWDENNKSFSAQETFVLDYKDKSPDNFSKGYGAGIVRLILAFHNTFGGVILFGVDDKTRKPMPNLVQLDNEALSDFVTSLTGSRVELVTRQYELGDNSFVQALLVPRREHQRPVSPQRDFDKFSKGTVWIRDRHSVRELGEAHLSMIFSDRAYLYRQDSETSSVSVHRTLPPSPATMQTFIGREGLLYDLWEWLTFDDRPRFYLHGPGGSGKSTLAYQFSKQVAEAGNRVSLGNGMALDYVIFVSAKETELNVLSATEQPFQLRRFSNSTEQFQAILVDSGHLSRSEAEALTDDALTFAIKSLFDTYSGLIVIDDVDALSRRGEDTGEEALFLAAMMTNKKTKILYTLRSPPTSALASSLKVPELRLHDEYPRFVESCAAQLKQAQPNQIELKELDSATSRLPLLIETIIGLHNVCGSYPAAVEQFRDRGGDAARRYLYQREYDRLERAGRSREVLAALNLLDEKVTFTVLSQILGFGDDEVRNAIGHCGAIFLLSETREREETLFQLAPPAKRFITAVSQELKTFPALARRIDLFLREDAAYTPEESAYIVQLEQKVRAKKYQDTVDLFEEKGRNDPILANQKVQALVGQAYSHLGPDARTKARECFKAAYRLKHIDVFMARAWFYIENESDYGNKSAIEVCEKFLSMPKISSRHKAEFKSKLANCHLEQARRLKSISREKTIEHYSQSIEYYMSSLWIARYADQIDEEITLRWLAVPGREIISYLNDDLEPFFLLFTRFMEQKHDLHLDGARLLMNVLRQSNAGKDMQERKRIAGLIRRTIKQIDARIDVDTNPGFCFVYQTLNTVQTSL
jgi:hypothetical protein